MAFQHLGEDLHAAVDGLGEVLFLRANHARDIGLLLPELWVLALIFMDNGVDDLIEERLIHAEELAVPGSSSEKTAQDIAAAFVGRQDTVADHEGRGADMVGDDAERDVHFLGLFVMCARELGDLVRDVHDRIDVKQRRDILTHAGKTL